MVSSFINALAENLADILTIAAVISVIALGVLFWKARTRHIKQLRNEVRGEVPVPNKVKEALAQALNVDSAEVATIGTVTLVDIAWHYSMADPAIWDHFHGAGADHIADALQNLEVLKSSMGDQALHIADNIVHYLQGLEATQVFHDVVGSLPDMSSAGDSTAIVLDAKGQSMVSTLADGATSSLDASSHAAASKTLGLMLHIPVVTIGFASYRVWKRSQKGAKLGRNLEFAAIEVTTRTGGGLLGSQLGGVVGTFIVPGVGTIIGGVVGAVAGAVGGALLGEEIKVRHVKQAQDALDESLSVLGKNYLADPPNFQRLSNVFIKQEKQYVDNLLGTQRKLRRYSMPWRVVWPNQKLILLQETVAMAEDRLGVVKQGTIEAVERLNFMRDTEQYRELGIVLWSDHALCEQLTCDNELISQVEVTNDKYRAELTQLGKLPEAV